jgi:hypothetical protein
MVTVSGKVLIDPTIVGDIELGISLPVASAFTAAEDCGGTIGTQNGATDGYVQADATNDRAAVFGSSGSASNGSYGFIFMYLVK